MRKAKNDANGPRIDAKRKVRPEVAPKAGKRGKSTARGIAERRGNVGHDKIATWRCLFCKLDSPINCKWLNHKPNCWIYQINWGRY